MKVLQELSLGIIFGGLKRQWNVQDCSLEFLVNGDLFVWYDMQWKHSEWDGMIIFIENRQIITSIEIRISLKQLYTSYSEITDLSVFRLYISFFQPFQPYNLRIYIPPIQITCNHNHV